MEQTILLQPVNGYHYYRDENEQYIGQVNSAKNANGSSHADDGKL